MATIIILGKIRAEGAGSVLSEQTGGFGGRSIGGGPFIPVALGPGEDPVGPPLSTKREQKQLWRRRTRRG